MEPLKLLSGKVLTAVFDGAKMSRITLLRIRTIDRELRRPTEHALGAQMFWARKLTPCIVGPMDVAERRCDVAHSNTARRRAFDKGLTALFKRGRLNKANDVTYVVTQHDDLIPTLEQSLFMLVARFK